MTPYSLILLENPAIGNSSHLSAWVELNIRAEMETSDAWLRCFIKLAVHTAKLEERGVDASESSSCISLDVVVGELLRVPF